MSLLSKCHIFLYFLIHWYVKLCLHLLLSAFFMTEDLVEILAATFNLEENCILKCAKHVFLMEPKERLMSVDIFSFFFFAEKHQQALIQPALLSGWCNWTQIYSAAVQKQQEIHSMSCSIFSSKKNNIKKKKNLLNILTCKQSHSTWIFLFISLENRKRIIVDVLLLSYALNSI